MKNKQYQSLDGNYIGEAMESVVFEALQRMAFDSSSSMLVMQGFELPLVKCDQVSLELPALTRQMDTFTAGQMKAPCKCKKGCTCQIGENDFLVLVPGIGAVVLEVKASANAIQNKKAVQQLHRMEQFLNIVCNANKHAITMIRNLPCVKVVCVPSDVSAPEGKDPIDGIWHLHQNAMGNFPTWWSQILADLTTKSANNGQQQLIASNFQHFVGLMAGLWSMRSYRGSMSHPGKSKTVCLLK